MRLWRGKAARFGPNNWRDALSGLLSSGRRRRRRRRQHSRAQRRAPMRHSSGRLASASGAAHLALPVGRLARQAVCARERERAE